ncbi:MAG: hypothetical protein FIB00_15285 [Chloroflexi bacterium]|nr:hypothetical protein [Chloroflexota bacterium]PWB42604.1 MAG: hypothetical protein C3F10_12695 [Dehalococcoidia bacterium]
MLAARIQRICRRVHAEESQSIVTVALMSLFILAILAVVVESSAVYIQRRNLQNAADAAALAGAQELDGTNAGFVAGTLEAAAYAEDNVQDLESFGAVPLEGNRAIRVEVRKKAATAFAGWLSFGEPVVSAKATARIAAPLYGGPGVVPLAIAHGAIEYGTSVAIKVRAQNSNTGNFGFIDFGSGANDLCNFIREGSDTSVTDPQPSEPGNVSRIRNTDCLPHRLNAARANACLTFQETVEVIGDKEYVRPECNPLEGAGLGSFPDYADTQPTAIIVVPVITTWEGCNGHCSLDVVGDGAALREFAFFLVDESTVFGPNPTCRQGGQNQCLITGRFIEFHYAPVSTRYELPTGEYDPNLALLKIIQLID